MREVLSAEMDPAEDVRAGRESFLEEIAARNATAATQRWSPRGKSHGLRWLLAGGMAVAGAAAIVIWQRTPVSFEVGPEGHAGRIGDLVEAPTAEPASLRFSDGSVLYLHEGGRMRVLSADVTGARVLVEDGELDATISHRGGAKTRWDFEAGPFRILVTGTKFHMSFRSRDGTFKLATEEGKVSVSGTCFDGARTVSAGEHISLSCAPAVPAAKEMASVSDAVPPAPPRGPSASGAGRPTPSQPTPSWRELLASGRLAEGLRAAERANFGQVCQVASDKELLALADAARLFGQPARAVAALRVLRQRHPSSIEAATAAFTLGRIAFEQQHAYGEAARWFATYLAEQPTGPLMGDSLGRLMEARLRGGDETGARADAQHYLHRFPEGPYASEARGILSK
jgi:TolA-binding protein